MNKLSLKDQIQTVAAALTSVFEIPAPSIALDLDGTIDEAPLFFGILSHRWPGKVFVITFRKDRAQAEADLQRHNIRYDELILVDSLQAKAKVVHERGIGIIFDDQDECLQDIDSTRTVFKARNGGNYDFEHKKWLYSDQTGIRL